MAVSGTTTTTTGRYDDDHSQRMMTKTYDNYASAYNNNDNRKQQKPKTKKRSLLLSWTSPIVGNNMTSLSSSQQEQQEQSNHVQVMKRVQERLDDFMLIPVTSCQFVDTYMMGQGFPSHTIRPSDRDAIFKLLYPYRIPNLLLYIGLEDGTIYYYYDSWVTLNYREPGNSGYIVSDDTMNEMNPYYKHYTSCIDSNNGTQTNCTMSKGMYYIDCINDCELITCPNPPNVTTTSNHLCQNYQVKYVLGNETQTLGYIPTSDYCVNSGGQPEQRPGLVLTNVTSQSLGNCYYDDGTTIVNRTLSGVYASCQPPRGRDRICYDTFAGAHRTSPYDPRARPWYISSKLDQTPRWTEPFNFFSDNEIGITYTHPMFGRIHNHNQSTFLGVIAVDYKLHYINDFLQEKFPVGNMNNNEDDDIMLIIIMETSFPNYIIASNGGGPFTKLMLSADPTLPCPWNETDKETNCQVQRIPIAEVPTNLSSVSTILVSENDALYTTKILQNQIYQTAFEIQQDHNFPIDTRIAFQVSTDPIGSPAYVVTGQYYQQQNNLLWHVFVIVNMHRSTNDAVLKGTVPFTLTCVLGTIGVLSCFVLFVLFYQRRNERAIQQSDYVFTGTFIFGCSIFNISTFTFLGENTKATCMLRMWSFNFLFVAALSPLFVKVWRMHELLQASVSFRRIKITNMQAFFYTLPLVLMETLILVIFTIADPPMPKEELGVGNDNGGIGVQQITCSQKSNAFSITQLVFNAGLVFIGCILAYQTRNLDPKFGESKQLCFAMYNIAVTGLLVLCTVALVDLSQQNQVILQSLGMLWASFFSSLAFVLPRLIQVQEDMRRTLTASNSVRISGLSQYSGSLEEALRKPSGLEFSEPFSGLDDPEHANSTQFGPYSKSIIDGLDASLKGVNAELAGGNKVETTYFKYNDTDCTDYNNSMTTPNEADLDYPDDETTCTPEPIIEEFEASLNDARGVLIMGDNEETCKIKYEDIDANIIKLPISQSLNTTHEDKEAIGELCYPCEEMESKSASIIEGFEASLKDVNEALPIGNREEKPNMTYDEDDGNIKMLPISDTVITTHDNNLVEAGRDYPGHEVNRKLAPIIEGIEASLNDVNEVLDLENSKLTHEDDDGNILTSPISQAKITTHDENQKKKN